ncbi:hypothetical protein AAVH_13496 [Aphelenchoides avenae]|nr:hypothetical protein AAVH_13496 [Aphelenchus avenae]
MSDYLPFEAYLAYMAAPKDGRTMRGEDYIIRKFNKIYRFGAAKTIKKPYFMDCHKCRGLTHLMEHTFELGCCFYDKYGCGACLMMMLTQEYVQPMHHLLNSGNETCAYELDTEFKLFALYVYGSMPPSRDEIVTAPLHQALKDYLMAQYNYP